MPVQEVDRFAAKLYKPGHFARLLDCSIGRIYMLVRSGQLRSVRLAKNGGIRIPATELDRLLSLAGPEGKVLEPDHNGGTTAGK